MNYKTGAWLAVSGPMFLIGCAGSPGGSDATAAPEAVNVIATSTESTLLSSLNTERRRAGKSDLKISAKLNALARGESDAAAASGRIPGNTTASLVTRSGFGTVGKLQGTLKDRGPQTGAGFVGYWAKGQSETLLDDWSSVGVGVSRAADGRLFAVVVFGRTGGSSLMSPAMKPSGL